MQNKAAREVAAAPRDRWLADAMMVLVAVIWGLNNVVVKASLAGWVTPMAFNSVRFTLGAVVISLFAWRLEPDLSLPRGLWWKVGLLGLVGNALNQILFINGIALSTANNAGLILAIIPIMVAIMGVLTGYDRLTLRLCVGAAISFTGIVLVVTQGPGGFAGFRAGDILLLSAATTWAGYTVFAAPLARAASPVKITAYSMAFAAMLLLAVGIPDLLRQNWSAVGPLSWAGLVYAGLCSSALGYGLYIWSVHRIGSSRTSLWSNLSPIVTASAAWLLLGERWVGLQWLGVILVFAGLITARWDALMTALGRE
jgi:drug/metabolite transporter (DMT)-like permease